MTVLDAAVLGFFATSFALLLLFEFEDRRIVRVRGVLLALWPALGAAFVWKAIGVIGPIVMGPS